MLKGVFGGSLTLLSGALLLFGAMPAGTTYKLQSYGVGSGGVANATSTNYALNAISGELSGTQMSGTTYKIGGGYEPTLLANVPAAPTITNPANYYNKLSVVIDTGSNPSDAKFAIAISSDNFVTTQYVQPDNTIGSSLSISDFQTYTTWGGSSGFLVLGLQPATTYYVKVEAMQGKFTQSGWSQVAMGATVNPSLTFEIDVSAIDQQTSPPYNLTFPDLVPGTVVTSSQKVWTSFNTNGDFGGNIYVYGQNGGLKSTAVATTIAALTGDLSSLTQGYGIQSQSDTQTSGGPFSVASPYNGTGNNVGVEDTTIRKIYSAPAPITAGRTSFNLQAKVQTLTPAAGDYSEILTVIGAASF